MRKRIWKLGIAGFVGLVGLGTWVQARVHLVDDGETFADGVVETVRAGVGLVFVLSATDTEVVLVDAGITPGAGPILDALERRGLGPEAVTAILLTHGHHDHVGGLPAFPGARVYGFAEDAELVARRGMPDNALFRLLHASKEEGPSITDRLEDGQVLRFGRLVVEVFAIPGHTGGSAAYLSQGVLFLGDSATALPDQAFEGGSAWFSEDIPLNHQSLQSLASRLAPRAQEVEALAFGHQGHLDGLQPLLDWARQLP